MKIERIQINFRGRRIKIDKRFLNAFSLMRYGEKYDREDIRKEVNKTLRDMIGLKDDIHPLDIYWIITLSLLSQKKQAELV